MTNTPTPTPPPATDASMPPPPRPSPPIVFAPKPLRIPMAYLPLVARTPSPAPVMARRGSIQEEGAMSPTTEANNNNNILDDFLKIVRSQREGRKTVSPLNLRRREEGRERPLIPASPVSRQLARNPMIFNTQFDMMPEEDKIAS